MNRLVVTAAVLAALAWAGFARAEQVTLRLEGLQKDEVGGAVGDALGKLPSMKVTGKPTKEKPAAVVTFDPKEADVGDMARAVAGIKTGDPDLGAPATILVLHYERLDTNPLADDVFLPKVVEPAFGKLKGADAKKCKLDAKEKELQIRLDPKGGAKLAEIKAAFPGLSLK
jgi:hypothetical protein